MRRLRDLVDTYRLIRGLSPEEGRLDALRLAWRYVTVLGVESEPPPV